MSAQSTALRVARCGHDVPGHSGRQRLACDACVPPVMRRKSRANLLPVSVWILCAGCRERKLVLQPKTGPTARFCARACNDRAIRAANGSRYEAMLVAKKLARAARNADQKCALCLAAFAAAVQRKYCSERCSGKAVRLRAAQRGGCSAPECQKGVLARGLCSTHYNNAYVPDRHRRWPGDPELRRRSLRRKTQARRAATRGVEIERVDRDVVGERDRWRCGICRHRIEKSLPWPHPKSPSLDHVIPLSEHGPHTYANCRIAHLDCNTKRGNRGGNEQLALIG